MRNLPRIVAETAVGETRPRRGLAPGPQGEAQTSSSVNFPKTISSSHRGPGRRKPEAEKDLAVLGLMLSAVTPELRERFKLGEERRRRRRHRGRGR